MAEQLLDRAQVRAAFQHVGRKRVAQGVRREAARRARRGEARPPAGAGRPRATAAGRSSRRTRPAPRRRLQGRAPRGPDSARAPAARALRPGRPASLIPCRVRVAPRSRNRASPGRDRRSPGNEARRSTRARTWRDRGARVARRRGCDRGAWQPRPSSATWAECADAVATTGGQPGSPRAPRVRPCTDRTCELPPACARQWSPKGLARTDAPHTGAERGIGPSAARSPARPPRKRNPRGRSRRPGVCSPPARAPSRPDRRP